jgi:uncharacterized membrane protein
MFVIGLILLVLAAIVAVVGVVTNIGSAAVMTGGFTIFGFPVGGHTGWLFLFGVIVGAVGLFGLGMMVRSVAWHRSRRRELKGTRREAKDLRKREEKLSSELEKERAERERLEAASGPGTGSRGGERADTRTDEVPTDTGRTDTGRAGTEAGATGEDRSAAAGPPQQRTASEQAPGLRERLGFGHRTKK